MLTTRRDTQPTKHSTIMQNLTLERMNEQHTARMGDYNSNQYYFTPNAKIEASFSFKRGVRVNLCNSNQRPLAFRIIRGFVIDGGENKCTNPFNSIISLQPYNKIREERFFSSFSFLWIHFTINHVITRENIYWLFINLLKIYDISYYFLHTFSQLKNCTKKKEEKKAPSIGERETERN